MRLSDFYPTELNLTSLYVLRDRLEGLRTLRAELLQRYAIDVLQLSSVLHLRKSNGELDAIAPPFVESVLLLRRFRQKEELSRQVHRCSFEGAAPTIIARHQSRSAGAVRPSASGDLRGGRGVRRGTSD